MGSARGADLRMVHLRTVPDAWQARVLAARLGSEGILTEIRGNLYGPYPFGPSYVLVEAAKAPLAAQLLMADEVEAALSPPQPAATDAASRWRRSAAWRVAAAAAAMVVAGAPLLAHLIGQ